MARQRSAARRVLEVMPLDGCVIFFNVEEMAIRRLVNKAYGGMLCTHKINGQFLNHGERKSTACDMYVCLSTADLTE